MAKCKNPCPEEKCDRCIANIDAVFVEISEVELNQLRKDAELGRLVREMPKCSSLGHMQVDNERWEFFQLIDPESLENAKSFSDVFVTHEFGQTPEETLCKGKKQ